MIDIQGTALTVEERVWLAEPAIGGVILFTRNFADIDQLQDLVKSIRALRTPQLLIAVDQEGGRVQRFKEPFTGLPAMRSLGHYYDEQPRRALAVARQLGWLLAAELRAVDIDLSFAPVVDVDRGLAEVIGDRALHADADIVAVLACELAAGAKDAGMAVVAKHFPTHAGARADSHTALAVDTREFSAVLDDLVPYRKLIDTGLHGIMAAHVSFPQIDSRPAGFSSWWLEEQLRGELRFSGAIFSDDLGMAGAGIADSCTERAEIALEAGCDMVLLCNRSEEVPQTIERLNGMLRPRSQLHLMRLRGRGGVSWQALRNSSGWREACAALERLDVKPTLRLEG